MGRHASNFRASWLSGLHEATRVFSDPRLVFLSLLSDAPTQFTDLLSSIQRCNSQFRLRCLSPRTVPIGQPSLFMRCQPQGHSIPTDLDVGMVVSLLGQPSNSIYPAHGGLEIGENLGSNPTAAFQGPSRNMGCFLATNQFHCPQTVRTDSSGSSFPIRKFFAEPWEQRSKGVPTGTQQAPSQAWTRVVPKTVHTGKFLIQPCLTGFALVVGFVHSPY